MWPYRHMNDPCHTHQNWVTHSKSAFHMACVWTLKTLGTLYVLKQGIISTKIIIYCLDCVVQPNALPNSAKFSLQTWTSIDFLRRHFHDNFCWDKVLHLWISLISIEQKKFQSIFPKICSKNHDFTTLGNSKKKSDQYKLFQLRKKSCFVIGTKHLLCSLGTSIPIFVLSAKHSLFVSIWSS